ncbi:hypothetical protein H9P43_006257 [Blastocladiella emersonii ATCC 22665]|nr:hypothetical protein H9P43_006257 [Blastocladiella emersonii ATCC 22665]
MPNEERATAQLVAGTKRRRRAFRASAVATAAACSSRVDDSDKEEDEHGSEEEEEDDDNNYDDVEYEEADKDLNAVKSGSDDEDTHRKPKYHPLRGGTYLKHMPLAFKNQIRAHILVHGPFATKEVIRAFHFVDYTKVFAAEGTLVPLEQYTSYVGTMVRIGHNQQINAVKRLMSGTEPDLPIPAFPIPVLKRELRGLEYNLAWMLVPAEDKTAGAFDIYPLLVTAAQGVLR